MDKLTALREWMLANGFFGLSVPMTDEYQGEYIAKSARRLEWLTGFTGSAGEAVILLDRAFLFVDGRYILQAQKETNPDQITVIQTPNARAGDWLFAALPNGARIGYDSWLHTPDEIKRMASACAKNGAKIVPLPYNPIDLLWTDKPQNETQWAVFLPETYTGLDSTSKIADVTATLGIDQDDALVLTSPESICWLLNVRGRDIPYIPVVQSFAVLYKNGTLDWFVNPEKIKDHVRAQLSPLVEIKDPELMAVTLDALGIQKARVQLDMALSPAWIYERLSAAGAVVHSKEDPCLIRKACKNTIERNGAVNAHIKDGIAMCRFLAWFDKEAPKGKLTEMDAVRKIAEFREDNPLYRGESFATIAASGKNAAYIHYHTSEKNNPTIKKNAMFLIDTGAQYLDGTTDITRTVAVGEVSALEKKRYTQVLKGHIAIAVIAFPEGTTGSQLDILARQFLWRDGVDYAHGTGHGIGSYLSVHEGPQRIARGNNRIALMPGMLISNEPGYYKADAFGIRLENVVMVEPLPPAEGSEIKILGLSTLSLAPFDRRLIDKTQLTPREKAWVDGYHARIRRIISPFVDQQTSDWLAESCAPL
ncbi:MAG: aminopeptidase P family protein [Alphaproteobacteria bacterium]|nr:aminopeptidase P family protein [Alphaproteobacteria bacterium]